MFAMTTPTFADVDEALARGDYRAALSVLESLEVVGEDACYRRDIQAAAMSGMRLHPQSPESARELPLRLVDLGRYEEALPVSQVAVNGCSDDVELLMAYGRLWEPRGLQGRPLGAPPTPSRWSRPSPRLIAPCCPA